MKLSFKKLLLSCLLTIFVLTLSCGDDEPDPTAQDMATELLLQGTWSLANGGSIRWNNVDISEDYTGFTMAFSENASGTKTYITTNSAGPNQNNPLFSANGTWDWADENTDKVIDFMDSDKSLATIELLTESTLRFRFTQLNDSGTAAGLDGLSGDYNITLTR